MLASSLEEQHLDWLENQERSASDRWRTDLYIAGTCLLVVITCMLGYVAVTNRRPRRFSPGIRRNPCSHHHSKSSISIGWKTRNVPHRTAGARICTSPAPVCSW